MKSVAESGIRVLPFDKIRKLYLARQGGRGVGHVVTTPGLEGIRITDLYVHPSARKSGVATSLIDEIKRRNKGNTLVLRARPYGVKGPRLERLKAFYRKMGFTDDIPAIDTMMLKVASVPLDTAKYMRTADNLIRRLKLIQTKQRIAPFLLTSKRTPSPAVKNEAFPKKADFATGLPDPKRFGDVEKLPKEKALKFVVQEHLAQRAGRHYDVRMGTPETGLLSWATKKEWPGPGGKIMLFQQPVHRYEYGDFQGTLPKGYGAGTVKTHDKGAVVVTHADRNKIKFIVAHKGTPEYYMMIRRSGPPKAPRTARQRESQGGNWLLINTTPTDVKKWMGVDPEAMAKLKYKSIPAEDVEKLFTRGNIIQNKVDGASMLYKLLDDRIEATSYRVSKEGRPIIHTQRLFGPGGMKLRVPKEHVGTVLRGEAYGERGGKAIPPQELGGLLNASVIRSLEDQRAKGVRMRSMLFDVAGEQDKPYSERLKKLKLVSEFLPKEHFHLPESARTPEEARALWEKIRSGSHPLTHEGIVAWPEKGAPTKAKLMPESDVWIRGVFPGEGKYKGRGAGGFEYSLGPEGEVVGRVGTGFSDEARREMLEHPEAWVGRLARIRAQEKFPSGAFRAPAFLARHEDYPQKAASLIGEVKRRSLAHVD